MPKAEQLIAAAKAWMIADAARMACRPKGASKYDWRMSHPIDIAISFSARDKALKTRPKRLLSFDCNGNPYDLWVWSLGRRGDCVERIDLRSEEAEAALARYEIDGLPA